MLVEDTALPGVKIISPRKIDDARGFFSETYNSSAFADVGLTLNFVQDNHSLSVKAGTVRGLHYQAPPFAQAKLVRVTRGSILDVAVDLRGSSSTYGQHVAVKLSADNWRQLLVPIGFAHGFCTLEDDVEVIYKVTSFFAASHDFGLAWNDPALKIAWPTAPEHATLSDRDRALPPLKDLPAMFA